MAGFMTVLSESMFKKFAKRIFNIHPALLPAFKGDSAVKDAPSIMASRSPAATIHEATLEMDAGPIIAQVAVEVLDDDTEETLHERIKVEERKLYCKTIRKLMAA